ncbi:MAG: DEAD/DEAH box helicase [Mycobacteriales bacterium]
MTAADRGPRVFDPATVLLESLARAGLVDSHRSALVDAAATVWSRPGFDTMISAPHLRFTPYAHQQVAAQAVLRRMRGRAILADEVGLGKTIEAGIVLTELRLRGLADRTLVLVPAGLVEQWVQELDRKFALPTQVFVPDGSALPTDRTIAVASLATARRGPSLERLAAEPWDLVIVDEAHRVRNPRSASGQLARALRTRFLLLLTATPVENRLDDLLHLVSLVSPGLLGSPREFRARHGSAAPGHDGAASVRDVEGLQTRLREVMVRHRRSEVALLLPQRIAETQRVVPGPGEAELYAAVARRLRREAAQASSGRLFAMRSLARLAGSSPAALGVGLANAGWADLAREAGQLDAPRKTEVLIELLRRSLPVDGKVVVFSAFRATVDHLARALAAAGLPAAVYHGSLARADKERVVAAFQADTPVLLTTEAAGEGRNLQFCHALVNYDLPWNPMQIEQRLGRLHRIGQDHDVSLTNLVGVGTVEERILHVLEAKINLFELVVGELDMILGRIDDDLDFEGRVFTDYVTAADDAEFEQRLEALGDQLAAARQDYLQGRAASDGLLGGLHDG